MPYYIKSHESPNDKPRRNSKGKLSSARLKQLKKSRNRLINKLKCFFLLDSKGLNYPCNEPSTLTKLIICKQSINLHIKLWSQSFFDFMEPLSYYTSLFTNLPPWVKRNLINQIYKLHQHDFIFKPSISSDIHLNKEIHIAIHLSELFITSSQSFYSYFK